MWLADRQSDGNSYLHVLPSKRDTPDLCDIFISIISQQLWQSDFRYLWKIDTEAMFIYNVQNKNRTENKIESIMSPLRFLCNYEFSEAFTVISALPDTFQQELDCVHIKWDNVFPMWEATYLPFNMFNLKLDGLCCIIKHIIKIYSLTRLFLKNKWFSLLKCFKFACWTQDLHDKNLMRS